MLVAGTATEVAIEGMTDLVLGRLGITLEKLMRRQNHPRRTETALQSVALPKRFLEQMKLVALGEPLDGHNIGAVRLDREHGARLRRRAVQHHRAGPADSGLAADMRARQPYDIAQKINQQQSRLHFMALFDAVDLEGNSLLWYRRHDFFLYLNVPRVIKFLFLNRLPAGFKPDHKPRNLIPRPDLIYGMIGSCVVKDTSPIGDKPKYA